MIPDSETPATAPVMEVSSSGARMIAATQMRPTENAAVLRLRDDLILMTDAEARACVLRHDGQTWSVVMIADAP